MSRRHQPEVTEPGNLGPDTAALPSLHDKTLLCLHNPLSDGEGHLLHCFVFLKISVTKPRCQVFIMNDASVLSAILCQSRSRILHRGLFGVVKNMPLRAVFKPPYRSLGFSLKSDAPLLRLLGSDSSLSSPILGGCPSISCWRAVPILRQHPQLGMKVSPFGPCSPVPPPQPTGG